MYPIAPAKLYGKQVLADKVKLFLIKLAINPASSPQQAKTAVFVSDAIICGRDNHLTRHQQNGIRGL